MDPNEHNDPEWERAKVKLDQAISVFADEADALGIYMPCLAEYVRLHGDELADKYPDDINGGNASTE